MDIHIENNVAKLWKPQASLAPVLVNSPHSGRYYPENFVKTSRLNLLQLRSSEDAYLDHLLPACAPLGIAALSAIYPRCYVDLNRAPTEIDVKMIKNYISERIDVIPTVRSRNGLGVIPSVVGFGQKIYARKLCQSEIVERLTAIYNPYHHALAALIKKTHSAWQESLLIDLHSMPSIGSGKYSISDIDIVIGDRFSSSCDPEIVDCAQSYLKQNGLKLRMNKPYAGGFITHHYARPSWGFHSMQIEIKRSLYMNEDSMELHKGFGQLKTIIEGFWQHMNLVMRERASFKNAAQ